MVKELRTTVGIKKITKSRMDRNRAPGQCYDGFIWQLIDLWEQDKDERIIGNKVRSIGVDKGVEVSYR